MKRRWFAVLGGLMAVLVVALVVVLGPAVATAPATLLLALGAGLFLLGGIDPVPDRVAWYRFVGLGEITVGLLFVLFWVGPVASGGRSTADLVLALAGAVNALVVGFIGVDWFQGGHHYDLSRFEPGPILGDR